MTYAQPDPSAMTPAELADFQRRCGRPEDSSEGGGDARVTVQVAFEEQEMDRVAQTSRVAGEDVATWVHDAALHEADRFSDRHTAS